MRVFVFTSTVNMLNSDIVNEKLKNSTKKNPEINNSRYIETEIMLITILHNSLSLFFFHSVREKDIAYIYKIVSL